MWGSKPLLTVSTANRLVLTLQRLYTFTTVMNMAPFMSFRVILVIEWQYNTWTNMIVKMTILRLSGSSDDKEKEKIGIARLEGLPLRRFRYPVSGRGSRGSRPSRVSGQRPESSSIGRTDAWSIGASDGCQKNRRHGRRESKPSQLMGTGWSDGSKRGIGALGVLCSRDGVKCPREVFSAPVQPTEHRSKASENDVSRREECNDWISCCVWPVEPMP